MSEIDPKKLKVAELREELKQRGLDTKGNKSQLVKRLQKYLKAEAGSTETDPDTTLEDSVLETTTEEQPETDEAESQSDHTSGVEQPGSTQDTVQKEESIQEQEPTEEPEKESHAEDAEPAQKSEQTEDVKQDPEEKSQAEQQPEETHEKEMEESLEEPITDTKEGEQQQADEPASKEAENKEVDEMESERNDVEQDDSKQEVNVKEECADENEQVTVAEQPVESKVNINDVTNTLTPAEESTLNMETMDAEDVTKTEESSDNKEMTGELPTEESVEQTEEKMEGADQPAADVEGQKEGGYEDEMPIDGEFQVLDSVGDTDGIEGEDERRGEKRHHSHSRDHEHDHDRHARMERSREPEESEDWLDATNVQLDRFNSDLNLRIDEAGLKASPITVEGFAYMWAGARSNYGVKKGKVAFEVKILENLNVNHLGQEETMRHVVRVGFSTDETSTQLGEEKFSYGYGGTGKASTDCKFENYGQKFGDGDVITAYVDFEPEKIEIAYAKNGEHMGTCFEIEKECLGDQALFPHVLTKNCEFECNFGEREQPFYPLKEGFVFINNVPLEERVRGHTPPAKKEDCEVIMMCGLPGAGKTVWAEKHSQENKEKRYNILGTNNIIDKMKVMGLPRKKNYAGRWDVLIEKSTRCLNRMLEMAAKKKRNYILDQTNVYPSAQRRKMRPFEGFQRKAVVIVPTEEEYKRRCEKREKEEGKEVPDSAVLEMKANFALPEEGTLFDKVEFVELNRAEAAKLVEKYNKEGRDAQPPPEKRFRENRFSGSRDFNRDNRYPPRGSSYRGSKLTVIGGFGGNRGYNDRRVGYNDRRGGSYMGYSSSDRRRYDDRRDFRGGRPAHYDNRNVRSYSGSSNWNKSGSGGGSWGNQGNWGNQGSWGNQGNWNNQGNWGGQNYQGSGNWSGQQGQNWGQNYNYNWPQNNWNNYNQNQGGGSWGGYNNYGSGGSSGGGYK